MKKKRINTRAKARLRDCKLWKECGKKHNGKRPCTEELKILYGKDWKKGTILWSKKVCYALDSLVNKGLVEETKNGSQK